MTGSTRGQIMVFQIYYINHGGPMKRTLALLLLLGPASGFAASNPDIKGRDISGSSYNRHARIMVDRYTSWAAALAACPAAGCILDATSPKVPRAMGTFDVGAEQIKVEFGPGTFTADHIVLRAGLWLQGSGASNTGTVIQSIGANSRPVMTIPGVNNVQVFNFKVDGIRFLGAAGNTSQDGLLSDVSSCTNCNLNYGIFSNLWFLGFAGSALHLKGGTVDARAANQFLLFQNVNAFRPSGINPVLKIEGYAGQIHFDTCEFDGASDNDGGDNIYLGNGANGGTNFMGPNTIFFDNLTSQGGSVDIHVDGGTTDIDIRGLHSEGTPGILLVSNSSIATPSGTSNPLIHLHDSLISATSTTNSGAGYVVNVTDPSIGGGARVVLENNIIGGAPDNVVKTANTNGAIVICRNNFYILSPAGAAPTVNVTPAQSPAATLDVRSWNHVVLTSSATNITTLRGSHLPGETVTFIVVGGTVQFATGGNLSLGSNPSPLIVHSGDSVTFTRLDIGNPWQLTAHSW